MHARDELRQRYPEAAARSEKSKATAIKMFCRECFGGSQRDAVRCTTSDCFLWPHAWPRQRREAIASDPTPTPGRRAL